MDTDRFAFSVSPPSFAVPAGACDCHLHVFGPEPLYPFAEPRAYTPPPALPEDARAMVRRLGLERAVLVQPSVYGSDNRRLLDALGQLGVPARGVAVIDPATADGELARLHATGVRGVRLNAVAGDAGDGRKLKRRVAAVAARVADLGWHVQLFLPADALAPLESALRDLPVEVVLDHMGNIPATANAHPALAVLRRLLEGGRCWVKLSGAYRLGTQPGDDDVRALARTLVATRPERVVWGSDWPHTGPHGGTAGRAAPWRSFRRLDTGKLLDRLADWVPDGELRRRILVDNPARLYGFP